MRILLSGLGGHMGAEVVKLLQTGKYDLAVAAGVDPNGAQYADIPCASSFTDADPDVDCIMDFSHHSATEELLQFALKHRLPLVLATTGQTEEELDMIRSAAKEIPLFFAANYSLGIALLIECAKITAAALPGAEIEIVEMHHNRKVDAPSGTALAIANAIREVRPELTQHAGRSGYGKRTPDEIGIHSVRIGNLAGIHEVIISTGTQTLTLKHEAHDRALFAEGAAAAAEFICGKPAGLYDMKSLIAVS